VGACGNGGLQHVELVTSGITGRRAVGRAEPLGPAIRAGARDRGSASPPTARAYHGAAPAPARGAMTLLLVEAGHDALSAASGLARNQEG